MNNKSSAGWGSLCSRSRVSFAIRMFVLVLLVFKLL